MTLEEAKLFVRNYSNYERVFGLEILSKCLQAFCIEDFSTFKYVILNGSADNYYRRLGYPVLCEKTSWEFEEWKGEWMRKVRHPAREYRVPDDCQLRERGLLQACLLMRFPYLQEFAFPTYHLDKPEELYIKCENGRSLYVPIQALLENDYSLVEKRGNDYWRWYYSTPDRKKFLDEELATFETPTALRLKAILDEGKQK